MLPTTLQAHIAGLPALGWRLDTWPADADVVAVPFPVADPWPRSAPAWHPLWAATAPRFVALGHLWATQPGILRAVLADYLSRDVRTCRNWQHHLDVPWLGRLPDGRLLIYDGHHRLAAAWWLGRPGAWCRVLDLTPLVAVVGALA